MLADLPGEILCGLHFNLTLRSPRSADLRRCWPQLPALPALPALLLRAAARLLPLALSVAVRNTGCLCGPGFAFKRAVIAASGGAGLEVRHRGQDRHCPLGLRRPLRRSLYAQAACGA